MAGMFLEGGKKTIEEEEEEEEEEVEEEEEEEEERKKQRKRKKEKEKKEKVRKNVRCKNNTKIITKYLHELALSPTFVGLLGSMRDTLCTE